MEAIKIVLAGIGCLGLVLVGSCTMLGMAGAKMVDQAVELEKAKRAERSSGADSSRFSTSKSDSGLSRYESDYQRQQENRSNMDRDSWKFGDPNADVSKR